MVKYLYTVRGWCFMSKRILFIFVIITIVGCEIPTNEVSTVNTIPIVWKGSLATAPVSPSVGWAYYNTARKTAFIWDGDSWEILAQDGISIIWKGELPSAPSNPELNWAYYNIIDGNSYLYTGNDWDLLAKAGRDGASGILLWLGTLLSAPLNPSAGTAYYNETLGISYIWDGDNWKILARDGTDGQNGANGTGIIWKGEFSSAPLNPELNWAYYNTSSKASYIWDGNSWKILARDGVAGQSGVNGTSIVWKGELSFAPLYPELNWAYYNTSSTASYIWDGDSWETLARDGQEGANSANGVGIVWQGELSFAPLYPELNWAYYNTSSKASYIWDGDSWEILARDGADGQGGANGVSIVWKGALAVSPLNPQLNWAYYNTSDNTSYIWDADSWEILAESGSSTIMVSITWKGSLTAAPLNPQIGWMYYNTILGKSYVWDGTSWSIVAQDGQNGQDGTSPIGFLITWKGGLSSAPVNPQQGWAYYDTGQKKSYIWDGSSWQILVQDGQDGTSSGNGTSIVWKGELSFAPFYPELNWAYYNTSSKASYIWDGDSWETLAHSGQDGTNGVNGTGIVWKGESSFAPPSPELNWAYYNTSSKASYIWDGDSWETLARDGQDGTSSGNGVGIVWMGESSFAPPSPELNWDYYNTSSKTSYIWDGDN
jgi:DNA-binding transcriptional regulator YdaS (Cro superfamily)